MGIRFRVINFRELKTAWDSYFLKTGLVENHYRTLCWNQSKIREIKL